MKLFKHEIFAIAMVGATLALSGCDENSDYLNRVETVLMKQCSLQTKNKDIYCGNTYSQTIKMAPTIYSETNRLGNPPDKPFERQGIIFIMEDRAFKKDHPDLKSLNEIYHELSGKYIYDAPEALQVGDTKKVDNKYVLSPQMYDELINAVKTCNRAAISSVQFQMGSTLSPEEYDKVMNIILECKKFQLEQAINQK